MQETGPGSEAEGPAWGATLWPYALVLALGLFVLLPRLGEFGFWDPWEPKYAESAREMLERGSYVVPHYREDIRLTKPILVYWGVLAGAALFGLNELGARVVGVTFALATMLAVYYGVSLLRGRQAGLLAALVLGTSPQFYFIARQAMPDVYLFTSFGACLLFFCLGLFGPERRRNVHFAVSYACFSLAVLAKGPVLAGGFFFVTLAVYAAMVIDTKPLWQPALRLETARFLAAVVTGSLLLAVLSCVAFLFGTSPLWWGYDSDQRRNVDAFRRTLLATCERLHLGEILLVLLAVGLAYGAFRLWRMRTEGRGWAAAGAGGLATTAVVAAAALVLTEGETRVLVGCSFAIPLCCALIVAATARLLRQPELWPRVQPHLRPIAFQAALFAIVFTVVAGPWHVAVVLKEGHGYFTNFIIKHNFARAVDRVNSSGVTDFYLRTLIYGFFPWCAFLPIALAALVPWWERRPWKRHGLELFLLIATAVIFVALSISLTKFPHYLAPELVPIAVLVGLSINRTFDERDAASSRLTWIVASMLYLLPTIDLLREGGVRYLVASFTVKRWVPNELDAGRGIALLLGAGLACTLALIFVRSRILAAGLVAMALLFAHYNTAQFIPELSRNKSMKYLCDTWRQHAPPDDTLGFFGDLKHGIFFYTNNAVKLLDGVSDFVEFMQPDHPRFCIIERTRLFKLRAPYEQEYPGHKLHIIDDSHLDYHLIANFAVPGMERDEPVEEGPSEE